LSAKDYSFVHFDGLNRYYLAAGHKKLRKHFRYGPSVRDEFQFPEIGRSVRSLVLRHQDALDRVRAAATADIAAQREAVERAESRLADLDEKLSAAHAALDQTRDELGRTQRQLNQMRAALEETHDALARTQSELEQTQGARERALDELGLTRGALGRATEEKERLTAAWSQQRAHLRTELEKLTRGFWWRFSRRFRKPSALLAALAAELAEGPELGIDRASAPVAVSWDELLGHDGEAFVRCAHATLLGREPEPARLRGDLARLMLGTSRETLAVELSLSDEGRRFAAEQPGAGAPLRRYRRRYRPFIGPLPAVATNWRRRPRPAGRSATHGGTG